MHKLFKSGFQHNQHSFSGNLVISLYFFILLRHLKLKFLKEANYLGSITKFRGCVEMLYKYVKLKPQKSEKNKQQQKNCLVSVK